MSSTGSWVTITDYSASDPLFGGSSIYLWCKSITFNEDNNIDSKSGNFEDVEIDTANDSDELGSNWSRRKQRNQYISPGLLTVKLDCDYDRDTGSTLTNGSLTLTPFKLFRLKRSDHTLYLYDENVIKDLIDGEDSLSFYTGSGIPVVLKTDTVSMKRMDVNVVRYSMTFWEDYIGD